MKRVIDLLVHCSDFWLSTKKVFPGVILVMPWIVYAWNTGVEGRADFSFDGAVAGSVTGCGVTLLAALLIRRWPKK